MDVVLLDKVENLGGLGDLVSVKPGYARNFLIPRNKAKFATKANIEEIKAQLADLEKAAAARLSEAQARAEKFSEFSVTISHRAGDEGKLFGSVGGAEIATASTTTGNELAKSEIRLPNGPLRTTGDHEIEIHLHPEVNATINVIVEAE